MKIIKILSESIESELNQSEKYATLAVQYKEDYPEAAKAYYSNSLTHMEAIKPLHEAVVNIIAKYKAEKGDPPAPMLAVYDYLHERQIEKTVAVKQLQELYKQ